MKVRLTFKSIAELSDAISGKVVYSIKQDDSTKFFGSEPAFAVEFEDGEPSNGCQIGHQEYIRTGNSARYVFELVKYCINSEIFVGSGGAYRKFSGPRSFRALGPLSLGKYETAPNELISTLRSVPIEVIQHFCEYIEAYAINKEEMRFFIVDIKNKLQGVEVN